MFEVFAVEDILIPFHFAFISLYLNENFITFYEVPNTDFDKIR